MAARCRAPRRYHGLTYEQRDKFFGDFFASDISLLLEQGDEQKAALIIAELLANYGVEVSAETILTELDGTRSEQLTASR